MQPTLLHAHRQAAPGMSPRPRQLLQVRARRERPGPDATPARSTDLSRVQVHGYPPSKRHSCSPSYCHQLRGAAGKMQPPAAAPPAHPRAHQRRLRCGPADGWTQKQGTPSSAATPRAWASPAWKTGMYGPLHLPGVVSDAQTAAIVRSPRMLLRQLLHQPRQLTHMDEHGVALPQAAAHPLATGQQACGSWPPAGPPGPAAATEVV